MLEILTELLREILNSAEDRIGYISLQNNDFGKVFADWILDSGHPESKVYERRFRKCQILYLRTVFEVVLKMGTRAERKIVSKLSREYKHRFRSKRTVNYKNQMRKGRIMLISDLESMIATFSGTESSNPTHNR